MDEFAPQSPSSRRAGRAPLAAININTQQQRQQVRRSRLSFYRQALSETPPARLLPAGGVLYVCIRSCACLSSSSLLAAVAPAPEEAPSPEEAAFGTAVPRGMVLHMLRVASSSAPRARRKCATDGGIASVALVMARAAVDGASARTWRTPKDILDCVVRSFELVRLRARPRRVAP